MRRTNPAADGAENHAGERPTRTAGERVIPGQPEEPGRPDFTGGGVPDLAAVQQNRTNLGPA